MSEYFDRYLRTMKYLAEQATVDQLTEIFFWIKRAPRDSENRINQDDMRKKVEAMGLKWLRWEDEEPPN